MSNQPAGGGTIDYSTWLPHDRDTNVPEHLGPFSYIGEAKTLPEFTTYISTYAFGPVKPDFIVLHNTFIPSLQDWQAGEAGKTEDQIKRKRKTVLDGLMEFYRDKQHWPAGPHLFIDDRYIWLFSEMKDVGVHAMWGNSFTKAGHLHYSIGIEVVGDYSQQLWPDSVAHLVRGAVVALQQQLQSFNLTYMYEDPASKPGNDGQQAAHPDRLRFGGLSSHRDYNKPPCPGDSISERYYLDVLTKWPAAGQYTVSTDGTRIRQGPGTQFPVVQELPRGTVLAFDGFNQGEVIAGNRWWGHLTDARGFISGTLLTAQ